MAAGPDPSGEHGNRIARIAVVIFAVVVAAVVLVVALDTEDIEEAVDDAIDDVVDPTPGETPEEVEEEPEPEEEPEEEPAVAVDDLAGVGANARALLRADVPRLVIEIAVQEGAAADDDAVDHAVSVLDREADKPDGVEVVRTPFSSDRREWSAEDIRAVADEHRTQWSDGGAVTIFMAYLRGSFEEEDVIGLALNASEGALFPERWEGLLEGLLGSDQDVERAVLTHEIGHLLGLVELVYDSAHDREHPDAPGHSENEDSVMHPAVRTTAVAHVFEGPPPDDFDQADRDDLTYLRTGER